MHSSDQKSQFGESLREAPIKILAGSEKTLYYVHTGILLAQKLSTVSVRMSGHWKDTGDGVIDWTDFDKQTVECVLQFLYTGDYHVPVAIQGSDPAESVESGPERTESEHETEPPLSQPDEEPQVSQDMLSENSSQSRPPTSLQGCIEAEFPVEHVQTAAGIVAERSLGQDSRSLGPSILMHAKVYSFAHRNSFSELETLSLQRLSQILKLVPCERAILFPHLVDAVHHIYDTTLRQEMREDPARRILSHYVASNYACLIGEELDLLAEEGGEFMSDVSNEFARLILSLESRNDELSGELATVQFICKDKEKEIQEARQKLDEWEKWNGTVKYSHRRRCY